MADIKIYGTLKNDTGEPIAYASQVVDDESGKTVVELIKGMGGGGTAGESMTAEEAQNLVDSIFD